MKILITICGVILSTQTFALSLLCNIESKLEFYGLGEKNIFEIYDFEKDFPDIKGFDGGNMQDDPNELVFSNQCDNFLVINFSADDKEKIRSGEEKLISGNLSYSYADIEYDYPNEMSEEGTLETTLTCIVTEEK